jgi:hypothetical protein
MAFERFELRVEQGNTAERLKLVWTGYGCADEDWTPEAYQVSKANVQQASEYIREILRQLAECSEPIDLEVYRRLIVRLVRRGGELHENLFSALDGDTAAAADAKRFIEEAGSPADPAHIISLHVIIYDETALFPWGFIYSGNPETPPKPLARSIADLSDFWLAKFRLITRVPGGRRPPNPRKPTSRTVYALHEEMFSRARRYLEQNQKIACDLEELLSNEPAPATSWPECEKAWKRIKEEHDSVLYLFGHSDGQRILLRDGIGDGDPDFELPVSGFERSFHKDRETRSASIVVLNGCRTAAPNTLSGGVPFSANFLRLTRLPGFHGFIATEAEVPSVFASRYGLAFLRRLCRGGQSVGETFDALRQDGELFPLNLLYTCFADRDFRLSEEHRTMATAALPEMAHVH